MLLSLGSLAFLVFAATLVARLRDAAAPPGSTALCLLGAGILPDRTRDVRRSRDRDGRRRRDSTDAAALQALNVLADGPVFVFLFTIGASAFLFGAGSATLATALLPRWLGWLAYVMAAAAVIPSHVLGGALDHIGLVPFAGLGFWMIATGIVLAGPGAARQLPTAPVLTRDRRLRGVGHPSRRAATPRDRDPAPPSASRRR